MINIIKRKLFEKGLTSTSFFRKIVRKVAYYTANNDPENVHDLALKSLNDFSMAIDKKSKLFDFPDLHLNIAGYDAMPFGTAAGLDKNGDALYPLSKIFGYLKPGTIIVPQRAGNNRPRVTVDEKLDEIYNAQGFPSKGLEYFMNNLFHYYEKNIKTPIIPSICGIPNSVDNLSGAYKELETLLTIITPYADGIEWNPFSPNTAALSALRTPKEFENSAKLIKEIAGKKLKVVKMGPYEKEKSSEWLKLVGAFLNGGGDGITAVNTYIVPKEKVPSKSWGYQSAGRSGTFLQVYRQRAIKDTRRNFPNAFIFATGGINSAEQAWAAFEAGANALEGYTPYTFKGFGLILEMAEGLRRKIKRTGYKTLKEYLNHKMPSQAS